MAEPGTVGMLSGKLLEEICNQLTWRIRILIVRNRDDQYTLGDLWPPVRERLEKTSAGDIVRRIATQRSLRNVTSHASPVSLNLSSVEAFNFADSILDLYKHVHCAHCRSRVRGFANPSCSCKATKL